MTISEFAAQALQSFADSPAEAYVRGRGNYDTTHMGWVDGCDRYPKLSERLLLPIYHPYQGDVCGLSCRAIRDGHAPKYWNTPGLKRKRLLYGRPRQEAIPGPVFLVEGQLDVWALEYLDLPAYAVRGSDALTGWQVGLLRRTVSHVIVWPDKNKYDEVQPVWRRALEAVGITTSLGPYPSGAEDPDEVCQGYITELRSYYHQLVQQSTDDHDDRRSAPTQPALPRSFLG